MKQNWHTLQSKMIYLQLKTHQQFFQVPYCPPPAYPPSYPLQSCMTPSTPSLTPATPGTPPTAHSPPSTNASSTSNNSTHSRANPSLPKASATSQRAMDCCWLRPKEATTRATPHQVSVIWPTPTHPPTSLPSPHTLAWCLRHAPHPRNNCTPAEGSRQGGTFGGGPVLLPSGKKFSNTRFPVIFKVFGKLRGDLGSVFEVCFVEKGSIRIVVFSDSFQHLGFVY